MLELNKVYNQDCFMGMKEIEDNSVDLIITDPPYNIGDSNKRTKVGNKIISNKEAWGEWDNFGKQEFDDFFINYLKECYRILKDGGCIYCFSAREDNGYFTRKAVDIGFKYLNTLAIIKDNPLPHFTKTGWRSAFELCFYMVKGDKPKIFNFIDQQTMVNKFHYLIGKKDSGSKKQGIDSHPTEKPLDFFKLLVNTNTNSGDLVFDGFMGSGTTAVAAKQLGRRYLGFEISEKYMEIINHRLKQETLF